jgi:hypothetical protein
LIEQENSSMIKPRRNKAGRFSVDRRGTSFLVPLGLGAVFVVLALLWISMASHDDRSSPRDFMSRPTPHQGGGKS